MTTESPLKSWCLRVLELHRHYSIKDSHFRGYSGHVMGMMCWLSFLTSMGFVMIVENMEPNAEAKRIWKGVLCVC